MKKEISSTDLKTASKVKLSLRLKEKRKNEIGDDSFSLHTINQTIDEKHVESGSHFVSLIHKIYFYFCLNTA